MKSRFESAIIRADGRLYRIAIFLAADGQILVYMEWYYLKELKLQRSDTVQASVKVLNPDDSTKSLVRFRDLQFYGGTDTGFESVKVFEIRHSLD